MGSLLQGEQVIDKEFIGSPLTQKNKDPDELEPTPEFVLSGIIQESFRVGMEWLYYSPIEYGWKRGFYIRGDFGLNLMQNMNNEKGNDRVKVLGMIELGYSFHISLVD